jgi:hypothetical protein
MIEKEPKGFMLTRWVWAMLFFVAAVFVESRVTVAPQPVILGGIGVIFALTGIGLTRKVYWSILPSSVLALLVTAFFSFMIFVFPDERGASEFRQFLSSLPVPAMWTIVVGIWLVGLLSIRTLTLNTDQYRKAWW